MANKLMVADASSPTGTRFATNADIQQDPYVKDLIDRLTIAERERDVAKANVRLVNSSRDDVWFWTGDGKDDPDSLTCPVVMWADTLRAILKERDETREEAARLLAAMATPAVSCTCSIHGDDLDSKVAQLVGHDEICVEVHPCSRCTESTYYDGYAMGRQK